MSSCKLRVCRDLCFLVGQRACLLMRPLLDSGGCQA